MLGKDNPIRWGLPTVFVVAVLVGLAWFAARSTGQQSTSADAGAIDLSEIGAVGDLPAIDVVPPAADVAELESIVGVGQRQAEAEWRLEEITPVVNRVVWAHVGDRWGGSWIDRSGVASALVVGVVSPTPADRALLDDFDLQARGVDVRIQPVTHSEQDLMAAGGQIDKIVGIVAASAMDYSTNSLIVRIPPGRLLSAAEQDAVAAVARTSGIDARNVSQAVTFKPQACALGPMSANGSRTAGEIRCDEPFRGGVRILASTGSSWVMCSGAFTAKINVHRFLLTAGHCITAAAVAAGKLPACPATNGQVSDQTWFQRGAGGALNGMSGSSVYSYNHCAPAGSGVDVARIRVSSASNVTNWIAQVQETSSAPPGAIITGAYSITNWGGPAQNQAVCKVGATSGRSCGTTTAKNSSGLWETTGIFSTGGDSGGAVRTVGRKALGILNGGGANNSMYFSDLLDASTHLGSPIPCSYSGCP